VALTQEGQFIVIVLTLEPDDGQFYHSFWEGLLYSSLELAWQESLSLGLF